MNRKQQRKPRRIFRTRNHARSSRGPEPAPARIYGFQLPDGTVVMARGSSLLETAAAVVGVADAAREGDPEAVRSALDRLGANARKPGKSIILCAKVGTLPDGFHPPPGYELADCSWCQQPVWISTSNHRLIAEGVQPVCSVCLPMH